MINDSRLRLAHNIRLTLVAHPDNGTFSMDDIVDLVASIALITDSDCEDIIASITDESQEMNLGWDFNNKLQFVMRPLK